MANRARMIRLGWVLFLFVVLVSACSSAPAAADPAPQTVTVNETDFSLDMPSSLSAGVVTFSINNKGAVPHSLEIQGANLDVKLAAPLQPGQSGTLQVTLQPGDYVVFCPVDDHRGIGMSADLKVK